MFLHERGHVKSKSLSVLAVASAAALFLAGCASTEAETTTPAATETTTTTTTEAAGSLLDSVIAAGSVRCGTRDALPGFAVLNDAGEHVGFDSDFCRVIAAAVLGDTNAVEMIDGYY